MESKYLKERRALKLKGAATPKEEREKKDATGVFYANQLKQAPDHCEECGKSLAGTKAINPRAIVAHIIPKREKGGCPSVALHPNNRAFLCGSDHTDFDNKGAAYVQNMNIFEVMKARVATFYDQIAPNERKNVPEYFRPEKKKHDPGRKK